MLPAAHAPSQHGTSPRGKPINGPLGTPSGRINMRGDGACGLQWVIPNVGFRKVGLHSADLLTILLRQNLCI